MFQLQQEMSFDLDNSGQALWFTDELKLRRMLESPSRV
jgi:hypothetical protein